MEPSQGELTMTIKIRSLVVSGVCLVAIACSDASSASEANKSGPENRQALPAAKPSFAQEETAALAALADTKPRTILDEPEKKKAQELALEASKDAGLMAELALAATHEEPIDFSRPLAASEVTLKRFVLANGVEGREPLLEADTFTGDTKIFAFMELTNPAAEPYAFRVHWEPAEGPASPYGVELHVKTAARFRTWSWTAIPREPGQYRAVLRTLEGEEIASREFTIKKAVSE
jgi:hypothetical protein